MDRQWAQISPKDEVTRLVQEEVPSRQPPVPSNTVTIHLRGSPGSIEDLLRSQGFEERQKSKYDWEQQEYFSVGPALPHPTREARYFHRVPMRDRHELIMTDRDLTQLWLKSTRF